MKKRYYAVYAIQNHTNFTLNISQLGFNTHEEAKKHVDSFAGGKFVIIEYYE